jgi:C1A family cysteine protease
MDIRKIQRYGWKPGLPELADVKYSIAAPIALPSEIDLRPDMPEVYDQKNCGSCTSQMAAAMYEYALKQAGLPDFMPSRLFIYYNERVIEGTPDYDSGAEIKDALKSMNKMGVCSEATWQYSDDINIVTEKPFDTAYSLAKANLIHNYATLDNTNLGALKHCLAHKFPIGFGFTVYSAFESDEVAKTGILNMPDLSKETVIGGHAVVLCGYDDSLQRFYVRNSWNSNWGMNGYFTMEYKYVTNPDLASDFWLLRLI